VVFCLLLSIDDVIVSQSGWSCFLSDMHDKGALNGMVVESFQTCRRRPAFCSSILLCECFHTVLCHFKVT
jgi:hypothetical protein